MKQPVVLCTLSLRSCWSVLRVAGLAQCEYCSTRPFHGCDLFEFNNGEKSDIYVFTNYCLPLGERCQPHAHMHTSVFPKYLHKWYINILVNLKRATSEHVIYCISLYYLNTYSFFKNTKSDFYNKIVLQCLAISLYRLTM